MHGQAAAESEKASVVHESPELSSTPGTVQNLDESKPPAPPMKLSFREKISPEPHNRNSFPLNTPPPDTVQHFAETYIMATKIWCAAAVRLAEYLSARDAQTHHRNGSSSSTGFEGKGLSPRFLESQERVLEEVRKLCKNFRDEVAKGSADTHANINRFECT